MNITQPTKMSVVTLGTTFQLHALVCLDIVLVIGLFYIPLRPGTAIGCGILVEAFSRGYLLSNGGLCPEGKLPQ